MAQQLAQLKERGLHAIVRAEEEVRTREPDTLDNVEAHESDKVEIIALSSYVELKIRCAVASHRLYPSRTTSLRDE